MVIPFVPCDQQNSPIPLAPFGCGRDEIVHPGHSRFVICGIV